MAQPKFTLYKHIKIDGQWRYYRAAVGSNNKLKPHIVVIQREGVARHGSLSSSVIRRASVV